MSIVSGQLPAKRRATGMAGCALAGLALSLLVAAPGRAELVVSQLIVEFRPGETRTADIEVFNNSDERSYAVIEPREIVDPGTAREKRIVTPDPAQLGLLASPSRIILEPRQRRALRIAAIGNLAERERVYRVTVKPVTGDVSSNESGLKLMVGYDLLVLVRPSVIQYRIRTDRRGTTLILTNDGNASVELAEGQQCDAGGKTCQALPAKRLYAGASWTQELPRPGVGQYRVRAANGWSILKF